MNFKLYRIKLIFLIILLIILSGLSTYLILISEYWLMAIWTILGILFFAFLILKLSEQFKRRLNNFIVSISHGEFKDSYQAKATNDDLSEAFRNLHEVYKDLRIEKEKNHQFLKTIVEHINIAMLCFDEDYKIIISNQAAMKLFNRKLLINIDAISRFDDQLVKIIGRIKSGEKLLYKTNKNNIQIDISVTATEFKLKSKKYKLISLQDIKAELEEQEIDSWRKLVRVLTHEIMNTAIPISTLASVTNQLLLDDQGNEKDLKSMEEEDVSDLRHSLRTIEKRSKGMVEFVQATKSYTKIPILTINKHDITELISNVIALLRADFEDLNIKIVKRLLEETPSIEVDAKLIEQVLINVLKNSMEAFNQKTEASIKIATYISEDKMLILEISDNGIGMDKVTLENALIPFFTTKKEGSGIGLSLSRQIMQLHHGTLKISSIPNKGTSTTLVFRI